MPARFSSEHGKEDARALAANLGITYYEVDINGLFQSFLDVLAPLLPAIFLPAPRRRIFKPESGEHW